VAHWGYPGHVAVEQVVFHMVHVLTKFTKSFWDINF